jgi:uncharacterized damage-inducible protein DinB
MNAEQAKFLSEQYAELIEREFPATCKVLAAVKEDARDYKPDEKSRSAWELAKHIAMADVWFLDGIVKGAFQFDREAAAKADSKFQSIGDVTRFYERALPAKLQDVRAMPADKLTREIDFMGRFRWPAVAFLAFANNHSVHHRGQLAAYLRAMGSKVPAIYGESADESIART